MATRFWQDDPDAPYAVLLETVETYCHPEAWDGAYEQLQRRVARTDLPDVPVFKRELGEALTDPSVLPHGALELAADYDDGSDKAFLTRLWRDLYPEEPLPSS